MSSHSQTLRYTPKTHICTPKQDFKPGLNYREILHIQTFFFLQKQKLCSKKQRKNWFTKHLQNQNKKSQWFSMLVPSDDVSDTNISGYSEFSCEIS